MEQIETASLTIPIYEPMKISYIKNAEEIGIDIILVSLGLSIQREIVTKVDAVMGKRLYQALKVLKPSAQFMIINTIGHITLAAHFLSLRLTKMSSLNIPTPLGIIPAKPPKHR